MFACMHVCVPQVARCTEEDIRSPVPGVADDLDPVWELGAELDVCSGYS